MKTVEAYTDKDNTTTFYIDIYGDIFDTAEEAEFCGIAGRVVVDAFYVGSLSQMRASALEKYQAALTEEQDNE